MSLAVATPWSFLKEDKITEAAARLELLARARVEKARALATGVLNASYREEGPRTGIGRFAWIYVDYATPSGRDDRTCPGNNLSGWQHDFMGYTASDVHRFRA